MNTSETIEIEINSLTNQTDQLEYENLNYTQSSITIKISEKIETFLKIIINDKNFVLPYDFAEKLLEFYCFLEPLIPTKKNKKNKKLKEK